MKLSELLHHKVVDDVDILGLCNDSRRIQSGDLFIAYPGAVADGRKYFAQVQHAAAVLYEPQNFPKTAQLPTHIPCIAVDSLVDKLAHFAAHFYGNPAQSLSITGVTGTNGKTTIAYQLAQAYAMLGSASSYIGTLGHGSVDSLQPLGNTTPDALCLQKLLAQDKAAGVERVCMEVSSHALSQNRVGDIPFEQGIYTNLSHEHLDYHHTMDAYAQAKAQLFATEGLQTAVINFDDAYSAIMEKNLPASCQVIRYGMQDACDVQALHWRASIGGTEVAVRTPWGVFDFQLKAVGEFNVYNALAVFASLATSAIAPVETIAKLISKLHASPGRMEIVNQQPCIIVDYAHTPDALANVLKTLQSLKPHKLWVVFGCGGDRDTAKRPTMGSIASEYADYIIVTNDNPRTESPSLIADAIVQGIPQAKAQVILDRKSAIHYALERAEKEDIVVVAGKGHEDYQILGEEKIYFSDKEIIQFFYRKTGSF